MATILERDGHLETVETVTAIVVALFNESIRTNEFGSRVERRRFVAFNRSRSRFVLVLIGRHYAHSATAIGNSTDRQRTDILKDQIGTHVFYIIIYIIMIHSMCKYF